MGEPGRGRRMGWSTVDRIMVPFQGAGDGTDELSWGQTGLWQGMSAVESPSVAGVSGVPVGATVEDMAALLAFMVGRHQSLRTRLRFRPGERPLQVCVTEGEVPLEVVDAGDDDPTAVADAVRARYQATVFDYEHEFPVRMAVIRQHDTLTHLVAVYLHLAIDAGGLMALATDILARDPVTGAAAGPVTGMPPLEQTRRQRTPGARRHASGALKYLEQTLRTMHPSQLGEPRYPDEGCRKIRYRSPATALAIRRAAAQEATTTSSVLLTAYAVSLARLTGNGTVMAVLLVSNRFRPGFADSVSAVVQTCPYLVDVGGVSLRDAVNRTNYSVFSAYKNSYYDPWEQDEVFDRVQADRGPLDYTYYYNDRRDDRAPSTRLATDDEIHAAVALADHEQSMLTEQGSTHRLNLTVADAGDAVEFEMTADSRFLSAADMVALTAEFEHVAVRIATAPTDSVTSSPRLGEPQPYGRR
jgi:hypothetical protein